MEEVEAFQELLGVLIFNVRRVFGGKIAREISDFKIFSSFVF